MPTAGYSGTPLVRKLGITPGSRVLLLGAPSGFRRELVGLPEGVSIGTRAAGTRSSGPGASAAPDLIVWFVGSRRDLERGIARLARLMGPGLWIAWPKKASGLATDVSENVVRNAALAHGLVDYKVCAINETWSGLKFARRRAAAKASAGP